MENENNSISEGALLGIPKSKLRESKSRHSHVTGERGASTQIQINYLVNRHPQYEILVKLGIFKKENESKSLKI